MKSLGLPPPPEVTCLGDRGFSLIELMIALAIGLFMMTGIMGVLSSTKQTYRLSDNLSRLQENARFAMDTISRELRMAGHWGCDSSVVPSSILVTPNSLPWSFSDRIKGYDNSNLPGFPTSFSSVTLSGTDAITAVGIEPTVMTIQAHTDCQSVTPQFMIAQSHSLVANDMVFVTNCLQANIFQISSKVGQRISYGLSGSIGNTSNCLGYTYMQTNTVDTLLARVRAVAFFIGTGASGEPALFWQLLDSGGVVSQAELVDGIENMQILYGLDTDADKVANWYKPANLLVALDWPKVVSIRVGLLMRTTENLRSQLDTGSYTIAGTTIASVGTTVTHSADLRIRKVVTSTIQLRN